MISTSVTEFRKNSVAFLDKVENGETVVITRHGRPVAEAIPPSGALEMKSWKRPALRLDIKQPQRFFNFSRSLSWHQ